MIFSENINFGLLNQKKKSNNTPGLSPSVYNQINTFSHSEIGLLKQFPINYIYDVTKVNSGHVLEDEMYVDNFTRPTCLNGAITRVSSNFNRSMPCPTLIWDFFFFQYDCENFSILSVKMDLHFLLRTRETSRFQDVAIKKPVAS